MRKEIGAVVRKLFDAGMKQKLAQFVLSKDKGHRQITPGTQIYRWVGAPDLNFFVLLQIHTKEADHFWVSVGWSPDGVVPGINPDLNGEVGARFNLGKFWNAPNSLHTWKLTKPPEPVGTSDDEFMFALSDEGEKKRIAEGISQAPACVDDAIDRIVEYALPYFESIRHARS